MYFLNAASKDGSIRCSLRTKIRVHGARSQHRPSEIEHYSDDHRSRIFVCNTQSEPARMIETRGPWFESINSHDSTDSLWPRLCSVVFTGFLSTTSPYDDHPGRLRKRCYRSYRGPRDTVSVVTNQFESLWILQGVSVDVIKTSGLKERK